MDRHHAHGILGGVGGARILGGARRDDVAAQSAQQGLHVDVFGFELRAQVAEEALEVREPVGPQKARGFRQLDERERAKPFDEYIGGVAREARAQQCERRERKAQIALPAFDAVEPRHVVRQVGKGRVDRAIERGESLGLVVRERRTPAREAHAPTTAAARHRARRPPASAATRAARGYPPDRAHSTRARSRRSPLDGGSSCGPARRRRARLPHAALADRPRDRRACAAAPRLRATRVLRCAGAPRRSRATASASSRAASPRARTPMRSARVVPLPGDPMLDGGAPGPGVAGLRLTLRAGDQRLERRLQSRLGLHHGLDHALDLRRGSQRTERWFTLRRLAGPQPAASTRVHEGLVGGEIRLAPAVDRLLGIADEEEARPLDADRRRARARRRSRTDGGPCPGTRRRSSWSSSARTASRTSGCRAGRSRAPPSELRNRAPRATQRSRTRPTSRASSGRAASSSGRSS